MTNTRLSVVPGIANSDFDNAADSFDAAALIDKADQAATTPAKPKAKPARARKVAPKQELREELTDGIDLADPAQVAVLHARYNSLNTALKKMASHSEAFEGERQLLEAEITKLVEENSELAVKLKHTEEMLELLKGSTGFGKQIQGSVLFGLKVGIGATLAFAGFAVVFL